MPPSADGASMVGVRLSWTCATCKATANTYQLTRVGDPQDVEIPPGWRLDGAYTLCGKHAATTS